MASATFEPGDQISVFDPLGFVVRHVLKEKERSAGVLPGGYRYLICLIEFGLRAIKQKFGQGA